MKNRMLSKYAFYYPALLAKTSGFFKEYRILQKSQYFERDRLNEIQVNKLKRILYHAKNNIPVYAELYKDIEINDIKSISDLNRLPFVTKSMLKTNSSRFEYPRNGRWINKKTTGGSTGQPVTIIKNREAFASELAATWRGYRWANIQIGDRQARFWGVPFSKKGVLLTKTTDLLCNRMRLSAFSFTESSLRNYTDQIYKFKPDYFYGYVSMLNEYADYILRCRIAPPLCLKSIITTSEVLHDSIRFKLEKIFNTKVYNEYGCGEIGSVAHECEHGSMHVCAENMIVEIIIDEKQCKENKLGEIVITELNNKAMPLIRYKLGDFAQLSSTVCQCGRTLPVIKDIKGRAYDIIRLKNGKMFHGEFFMYIFEDAKKKNLGIGKFQVIQKSDNDLLIKIINESGYCSETEKFISNRIRNGMGEQMNVNFQNVNEIPREKSGKMRLICSLESANRQSNEMSN